VNILVTGGRGQLGRDCTRVLKEKADVLALSPSEMDITSQEQIEYVFRRFRPAVVINCAAYTRVDQCETELEPCHRVNSLGPELLARQCRRDRCRLVHISTDYVFSGDRPVPTPYTEDDPVGPLSAYGRSKLEGEEAIRRILDNHLIIRTAWLYGMGGNNFLKTMLRLVLTDPEQTYRVVDDQYGSLTWTWRLAGQIASLVDSSLTGVIHATAEGYSTWYAGARCFLEAMDVPHNLSPCSTAEYPTPAPRPANSILENRRLKEGSLNLMVNWQEDIRRFARQFRQDLIEEIRRSS